MITTKWHLHRVLSWLGGVRHIERRREQARELVHTQTKTRRLAESMPAPYPTVLLLALCRCPSWCCLSGCEDWVVLGD